MSGELLSRRKWVLRIAAVLAAVCFAVDLNLPLGVAGGVPYVTAVLVCLWSPQRRDILLCTVNCTALTLLGYLYSPSGGEYWMVLSNRALAIFAVATHTHTLEKRFAVFQISRYCRRC